ncbi:MAG: Gldg family protein, partial [Acidimicrobiia bacterium]|nr:Gldg family protein [Acidimicrobiia bacterium]
MTVARRELKSLFDHPTGYILVIIFVAVNDFLFFRQAYTFNTASLRAMLELMPWLFLFFIPAVTMRALAEDARNGTAEVVLSHPLTERDYLLGKYVGQLVFVWMALALTLAVPVTLSFGSDLHVGVVVAQYVGASLLAAGLTAVGVWASSLTKNQITAFIIAVTVMFLLVLVGLDPLLLGLPPSLAAVAARLGVLSHFRDIARGVIDLRDVIYFVTLVAIFLSLAYRSLMRRKLSPVSEARRRLQYGVSMLVLALIVVNLFGRNIGGRLDLTPGKAYTLSSATRTMLREVDDLVTLRLFVSDELPPEVALLRRDIDDLLRDYRNAGGDNLRLVIADPSEDPDLEEEARALGIPPVQFNVVGESQFTVRDGYMGLAVQYADQTETIPFIRQTDDLEYRISSLIRQMTDTSQAVVGYYVDPGEQSMPGTAFNAFRRMIGETYEVRNIDLDADTIFPADMTVAVFVGSPDSLTAGQESQLRAFLDRGGSVFVAASGMRLSQQQFAMARPVGLNSVLEAYGVTIGDDMVYDLISNEMVATRSQFGQLLRQYPLWIR